MLISYLRNMILADAGSTLAFEAGMGGQRRYVGQKPSRAVSNFFQPLSKVSPSLIFLFSNKLYTL